MVSMPKESGTTSSNNISLSFLLPTKISAWIAAPKATTLSGSIEVNGVLPKIRPLAHVRKARELSLQP